MKDYKPKVITVTKNMRATKYPNEDFDISFLYDENRRWDFKFSKFNTSSVRILESRFFSFILNKPRLL